MNPINCEFEYDKSCDIGEYLDYENYKCRKKLVGKLIDECTETIEETSLVKIISTKCKSNYCTLYIVWQSILELLLILFNTNI